MHIANTTERPLILKYSRPVKGVENKVRIERIKFVPGEATEVDDDLWEEVKENKMCKIWLKEKMLVEGEMSKVVETPEGFEEKKPAKKATRKKRAAKKDK